jgi:hypothetical protein
MNNKEYISIPKGLPTVIAKSNKERKMISAFYQLKSLYVGGIIHNYSARAGEIAKTFSYSERKLRGLISDLRKANLVSVDANKSLILRSSKFLGESFKVSTKRFYKIDVTRISDLEEILKGLVILDNIEQQVHILRDKVTTNSIYRSVGIYNPTTASPTHSKKMMKIFGKSYDRDLEFEKKRYTDRIANLQSVDNATLFPFATLTRQGIATVFGKKSKSTGHRWIQKLSKLNIVEDKNNNFVVVQENVTWEDYAAMQQTVFGHDYSYKFKKGTIIKVLPNLVSFKQSNILIN